MEQKVVVTSSQLKSINNRRKRSINIDQAINELRKRNRNSGQPFIASTGVPVPGKLPSEGKICSLHCQKRGCLLNAETKQDIFNKFYSNGSYNLQTTFLISCLTRQTPIYDADAENHSRLHTYKYFLPYNGERHEVCQTTFKDTLKIKDKRVRIVQEKILKGEMFGNDLRGTHNNRPHRLDGYTLDLIRTHIRSFPTELSHYKRNVGNADREYLPPGLNASKMFRLFKDANPNNIKVHFLKDAYCKELKMSGLLFAKMRSDTCSQCDKLFIAEITARNEHDRNNAHRELEAHHDTANEGYIKMREDVALTKADPSVVVLCVDLEQVLFSPTLVHKEMFYLRQLSSYNYCIYNTGTDEATMSFWTEVMATRGSEEMLSCLWMYISNNFEPLEENSIRSLVIWSDRCSGQNNNYVTLCFAKLLIKRRYFSSVDQKFLFSGHSFLVCDRLFGLIEKQKKKAKVFVPGEWINVFESARPSKPFTTQVMTRENFKAFDDLLELIPRSRTLRVTQAIWFRMTRDDPAGILSKNIHNDNIDFVRHEVTQPFLAGLRYNERAVWTDEWLDDLDFRVRNEADIPIDGRKYADLQTMLEFLEPQYREYYRNLPHH